MKSYYNRSQSTAVATPVANGGTRSNSGQVTTTTTTAANRTMSKSSSMMNNNKVYIDGSNLGSSQLAMRAPASTGTPAKTTIMATGVGVHGATPRSGTGEQQHRRINNNNNNNNDHGDVSQSTMAFIAAEQLVEGGLSESVIHHTIDQIQQQQQQQQQQQVSNGQG